MLALAQAAFNATGRTSHNLKRRIFSDTQGWYSNDEVRIWISQSGSSSRDSNIESSLDCKWLWSLIYGSTANANKLFWVNQWFFKLQTGFTKISIVLIYAKIFNKADSKTIHVSRILNYCLGFTVFTYYIAGSFVSMFQCTPVNKVWQKKLPGKCIDNDEFRMANAFINVITSAWIIILPLPTLLQLQARGNELTQLMGLILLGTV